MPAAPKPVPYAPLAPSGVQPLLADLHWDTDARETAYRRARELARRDPEAAEELLALLEAQAQPAGVTISLLPGTGTGTPVPAPATDPLALSPTAVQDAPDVWDPMAAYAACARAYHFGHHEMERMHYPTFFGYLREAVLANEREAAAVKADMDRGGYGGAYGSSGGGSPQEVLDSDDPAIEARLAQYAAKPRRWEFARDS